MPEATPPAPAPTGTPYSQIRPQLQTGDILGFEGHEPIDFMINFLETGKYSHVGIVLRDQQDNLWLWDAPGGGNAFPDPYWPGPGPNPGARVADLDTILDYYINQMGIATFTWRQLTPSLPLGAGSALDTFIRANVGAIFPGQDSTLPPEFLATIQAKYGDQGTQAVTCGLGLLLTYFAGSMLFVQTSGFYYCAQLAAATYMACGLLPVPAIHPGAAPTVTDPKILPPNGYTPADFMDQPKPLTILPGHTLAAPVPVAWDRPLNPPAPTPAAATPGLITQPAPPPRHTPGHRPHPMDLSLLLNPALFKPHPPHS